MDRFAHRLLRQRFVPMAVVLVTGICSFEAAGAPPTALAAIPGNGIVSLVWKRPDLLKTETYNIYRSTTQGNTGTVPYVSNVKTIVVPTCLNGQPYNDNLTFLRDYGDTGVTNGTTYYYQVSMVRGGVESARTAEVRATPIAASHAITKSRMLKIMPMGNSITGGWCAEGRCGEKGGYRGFLLDSLTRAGYQATLVGSCIDCSEGASQQAYQYHEGWGSRMVQDILRTVLRRALDAYDPDLILLEIGTNNFAWGGTDVNGALKAYDSLLLVVTTLKPDCRLLVAPILPLSAMNYVNSFNTGVRKKVDSLAALGRNVTWVSEMSSITQVGSDGIHPSATQYPGIAGKWFQAIKRVTDASSVASRGPAASVASTSWREAPSAVYTVRGSRLASRPSSGVYLTRGRTQCAGVLGR